MISVISPFGNKTIDSSRTNSPILCSIKRIISIEKINPEDYEDEESNMSKNYEDENFELTDAELAALEKEIPPEVDNMSDEEFDDIPAPELDHEDEDLANDIRAAESEGGEELDDDGVKVKDNDDDISVKELDREEEE